MTAKKWVRAAAALLLSGMLLCTAGCATLSAVLDRSRTEPTTTPTPAPTAEPSAESSAEPTAEPPAEPTAAPTAEPTPEATAAPLTEAALLAQIDEATAFFCDWFYDRSAVIDPAYGDDVLYPPYNASGAPMVYPTAVDGIASRDALLAATERYFDADTAEALLDSVYAQDVDGFLCVSKSLGLGGPGYDVTLTVTDSGDGSYTIRMDSVLAGDDLQFDPVSVQYRPANGTAIFGGDYDTIQSFFITCLYINECTVVFE